jgi:hypothetical protein
VAGNAIFTGVVEGQRALGHIWRKAPSLVIRWHDLRHTSETLVLTHGTHPKLVPHLLGHASITITLDRYSHWIPTMGRHAAEVMDEALEGDEAATRRGVGLVAYSRSSLPLSGNSGLSHKETCAGCIVSLTTPTGQQRGVHPTHSSTLLSCLFCHNTTLQHHRLLSVTKSVTRRGFGVERSQLPR